ncbi:MAG TPA: uroporphyrinogen-III C-methyltransferase [Intrasporangium sp.]|uniref:uroporphyrinogen-III C-methyltransferase n=1 Tax=Intrasporangium sp. TaxID=1925024 RepID=UPI002D791896|nr:uroporphyrinogen-III C-methyltransferase [Intrasporangium sp.]HET7399639.1 uroporphyrinogen-III C-methyltransferase [Intrasporangium sp.]
MRGGQEVRLTLPLSGRRVVVVGGGPAALRRVSRLLRARARVEIVAPRVEAALEDLAARGEVAWHPRTLRPGDLDDAWLVVAATGDAEDDERVVAEAESAGRWAISPGHGALDEVGAATAPVDGWPGLAPGSVTLVGGGPGDEGLVTVAGARAVRAAEVLVVDRLAPLALLDSVAADAEIVDVSKIPRGRSTAQEDINAVLVERARAGRRVVRLKGGDPYVFGRGMEEAQACAEAGVPVHVIPGVTSAVAGPALAGIPVTHRGVSQGFTVVSGHVPPGDPLSTVDWDAVARTGTTLVLLMAVHTLPDIAAALVTAGLSRSTPLAGVMDAGLPSQRSLLTSVGEVVERGRPEGLRPPAIIVIGQTAAFVTLSR